MVKTAYWATLTQLPPPPSPPPRFAPSFKAYLLVHVRSLHLSTIPFVLVSNFPFVLTLTKQRTCLGYRSRKICQTIAVGFFLPNEVISYVYKRQSICSVLVNLQHHMRWFSLESPVVERKNVFTRFKTENDLSLKALVGRAKIRFPSFKQFQNCTEEQQYIILL